MSCPPPTGLPRRVFVLVVGAGFGGIAIAVALRRAGISDFLVLDRADGPGGVWRANRYPGAGCDIPSHLYSFSFAPDFDWSRRYAPQPEILAYLEDCVERFGLVPHLRFGTGVAELRFDAGRGDWAVALEDGAALRARVVIPACGQLSRPRVPALPGLERFAGPCFHSARWRPETAFAGRRVGVIGTGASAIQAVPRLAEQAEGLVLFQRSAPYVFPKPDRAYDPGQRARARRQPWRRRLSRWSQYWSHELRGLVLLRARPLVRLYEWRYRRLLRRVTGDPALRAALTPREPLGCKRILFSNDYLQALASPAVTLETGAIEAIEPDGVRTRDGTQHRLDVLVLATGFRATEFLAPMRVVGRQGRELSEVWRDGAEAYLGMTVSGFPNLFMIYGPNTNLGHNSIVFIIESQLPYVLGALRYLQDHPERCLDLRAEVGARAGARLRRALEKSIWARGCSNWYTDAAGRVVNNWPGSSLGYRLRTRRLRLEDYRTTPCGSPGAAA